MCTNGEVKWDPTLGLWNLTKMSSREHLFGIWCGEQPTCETSEKYTKVAKNNNVLWKLRRICFTKVSVLRLSWCKMGNVEENQFHEKQVGPLTCCVHLVGTTSKRDHKKGNVYFINKATEQKQTYSHRTANYRAFLPSCLDRWGSNAHKWKGQKNNNNNNNNKILKQTKKKSILGT